MAGNGRPVSQQGLISVSVGNDRVLPENGWPWLNRMVGLLAGWLLFVFSLESQRTLAGHAWPWLAMAGPYRNIVCFNELKLTVVKTLSVL